MRVIENMGGGQTIDPGWDAFVAEHPANHLLQASRWGALKARFGWTVERLALCEEGKILAGAQIMYRQAPGGWTLAYVPKGPIVDWNNEDAVNSMLAALREQAGRRRAFCLKLEPDLPDEPALAERLKQYVLHPSPQPGQPRATILVDLDREEDALLSSFKHKTRVNIRLAERKGVVVREGTAEDMPAFLELMHETARHSAFAILSDEYYRAGYELYGNGEHGGFYVATADDRVVAGLMVFISGRRAWNMYGGQSEVSRGLLANYPLRLRALRDARNKGCTTYDLWGIPDDAGLDLERDAAELASDRHDGCGVCTASRAALAGRWCVRVGTYDDTLNRPVYWLYTQANAVLERLWGETWHRKVRSG